MAWKKVEQSPMWNGKKEDGSYKLKSGDEIVGILKRIKTDVGRNKAIIYTLKLESGEMMGIWGSTVLDGKMEGVELGEQVKIVYLGTKENDVAGRNPWHDYEVFHRTSEEAGEKEEPQVAEDGTKAEDIPFGKK